MDDFDNAEYIELEHPLRLEMKTDIYTGTDFLQTIEEDSLDGLVFFGFEHDDDDGVRGCAGAVGDIHWQALADKFCELMEHAGQADTFYLTVLERMAAAGRVQSTKVTVDRNALIKQLKELKDNGEL